MRREHRGQLLRTTQHYRMLADKIDRPEEEMGAFERTKKIALVILLFAFALATLAPQARTFRRKTR
jgi:hypothetical protein